MFLGLLVLLVTMYMATTLGITVGFHRLLTHRAFETRPSIRYMAHDDPLNSPSWLELGHSDTSTSVRRELEDLSWR